MSTLIKVKKSIFNNKIDDWQLPKSRTVDISGHQIKLIIFRNFFGKIYFPILIKININRCLKLKNNERFVFSDLENPHTYTHFLRKIFKIWYVKIPILLGRLKDRARKCPYF